MTLLVALLVCVSATVFLAHAVDAYERRIKAGFGTKCPPVNVR
jgi:hypothetical protein